MGGAIGTNLIAFICKKGMGIISYGEDRSGIEIT
jgi:hypothetical protein